MTTTEPETDRIECAWCEVERAFYSDTAFETHVGTLHPEVLEEEDVAAKTPSGANAPYKIKPVGKKFAVLNNAGETKATFDSRAKALKYLAALYASVPGAAKRAAKNPFTGKAENRVPVAKTAKASEEASKKITAADRKAAPTAPGTGLYPIESIEDLMKAVKAYGAAKNKPQLKAHIVARARALKATHRLPKDWRYIASGKKVESAGELGWSCPGEGCDRAFLDEYALQEHADAVHTFDDIRQMVSEEVREQYNRPGNYQGLNTVPSIYAWVVDLTSDWVVFSVEGVDCKLYQAPYTLNNNSVTLGTPVEVVRRTVYEPAPAEETEEES